MSNLKTIDGVTGIAAGVTTTIDVAREFGGLVEKIVVELAGAATSGTMAITAKFRSGDYYSMGDPIDFSANVPVVIDMPGVTGIRLTPTTLNGTYDHYISGKDL